MSSWFLFVCSRGLLLQESNKFSQALHYYKLAIGSRPTLACKYSSCLFIDSLQPWWLWLCRVQATVNKGCGYVKGSNGWQRAAGLRWSWTFEHSCVTSSLSPRMSTDQANAWCHSPWIRAAALSLLSFLLQSWSFSVFSPSAPLFLPPSSRLRSETDKQSPERLVLPPPK